MPEMTAALWEFVPLGISHHPSHPAAVIEGDKSGNCLSVEAVAEARGLTPLTTPVLSRPRASPKLKPWSATASTRAQQWSPPYRPSGTTHWPAYNAT